MKLLKENSMEKCSIEKCCVNLIYLINFSILGAGRESADDYDDYYFLSLFSPLSPARNRRTLII
jgi:hypothetical protein